MTSPARLLVPPARPANTQPWLIPAVLPADYVPVCKRSRLSEEMFWMQVFKERGMIDPVLCPAPHPTVFVPVHSTLAGSRPSQRAAARATDRRE